MYSFFRVLFPNTLSEREKQCELLDIENKFMDQAVIKETNSNVLQNAAEAETEAEVCELETSSPASDILKDSEDSCSARKGIITQLTENSGIIDNNISFDKQVASDIFYDLHTGCVVQYLIYENENKDIKVVKIQKIIEHSWEEPSNTKVQEKLEALKLEQPTYFDTQLRNILGVITERLPKTIEVDTDYGDMTVTLDSIELSFIPKTGDNICLECKVQLDDGFVDKQGEILEVKKAVPARIESNQKCTVERVYEDIIVLTSNAYVLKEDVPKGITLHLGDIVKADLIECQYSKFSRRALKLTMLEKNFGEMKKSFSGSSSLNMKQAIFIQGEDHFIFTEQWKKQNVVLKVKNTGNRSFILNKIDVDKNENAQIKVLEPVSSRKLEMGREITLILEVHPIFIGESKEYFTLIFDTFKVKRSLTIILCETEQEAKEAKLRVIASEQLIVSGRTAGQRSRCYANQVWSQKGVVVPGKGFSTRRRFVHQRLGIYEVPAKLLNIVLGTELRTTMLELLSSHCPYLKETLNIDNYVHRFDTLMHMEEIEYTLYFRNYDRERAHFEREGEYLSLQIENLAERRPSLVLGDTVRAINPWGDANSHENKTYEGVVHKVLFNRVLLKFNTGFHEKYNGEDYRLTFFFSRYVFRKQHHAVGRIVNTFGEKFLFPNKAVSNQHLQLEVTFKDDHMYLFDNKLHWYNPDLNTIQKLAVYNILRGETRNMPYVIFGPPGTGKTVTLVETILQLVRNLPNARLLVGTPSNSSADLITKRLMDSKVLSHGDFVRMVSQNQVEKDLIPQEIMSYCATGDIGLIDPTHEKMIVSDAGLKLRCQKKFLNGHRVTISTCTTLGNFLQMDFTPGHFTHVLIDEAGQCTEPETIMPISLLTQQRSQVILAGDPHQLQPIVVNRDAVTFGLNLSFLERLLERVPYRKDMHRFPNSAGYNPTVLTKLLYNYRALPSLMSVYSKLFYDNELISMIHEHDSPEARLLADLQNVFEPHKGMPVTHGTFFHGILGENLQEDDSPSWYNSVEAREVFLMTLSLYRRNVDARQIGILTPYAKQVKTLRNMFIGSDVVMPKIGSVEEFQGQEREVMLISTVRSSHSVLPADARLNLGFVRCMKRMNVAISRARCLMVVFGNPHLLCVDDCWRHLVIYCANNNAYFGCDLPKSILEPEDDSDAESVNSEMYDCVS